jgi:hypothetical protein
MSVLARLVPLLPSLLQGREPLPGWTLLEQDCCCCWCRLLLLLLLLPGAEQLLIA